MKAPHIIHANAVYDLETAAPALDTTVTCLKREIRLGRLRVSRRSRKYYILGAWLLAWLEAGQRTKRRQSAAVESV